MQERDIEPILRRLKSERDAVANGHKRQPGFALVIGAGCSATAEIPVADGFVDRVKERYRHAWDRAEPKDYIHCMDELTPAERQELIHTECTGARKLNAAHLAIAQLMEGHFVRYVLTTNFDSLIVQACTLLGVEPAVYDFTALTSEYFSPGQVEGPAVFHLHGQHSGVVQINTHDEFKKHSKAMNRLFESINDQCVWLVVGFSGENNPTLDQLIRLPRFMHRLYWVAYRKERPSQSVLDELNQPGKEAFLVPDYDADRFFVKLAREVGCETPRLFEAPFSHLESLIQTVSLPDKWPKSDEKLERETAEMLAQAMVRIHQARRVFEDAGSPFHGWHGEEVMAVPEPHPGLVLNLPRFNKRGYLSTDQLVQSVGDPDFRVRALQSNWGPLIVAVEHHSDLLDLCWLVCSPQVRDDFARAEQLIRNLAPNARCRPIYLEDHNSILDVQQRVKRIYDFDSQEDSLKPGQIIADITGGNSAMTGGVVLATLDEDRAIEYLRQDVPLVQKDADGKETALSRNQIREQQVLIGIRTSGAMVREAAFRSERLL